MDWRGLDGVPVCGATNLVALGPGGGALRLALCPLDLTCCRRRQFDPGDLLCVNNTFPARAQEGANTNDDQ